jgi:ketosteroid isomerase-like protein
MMKKLMIAVILFSTLVRVGYAQSKNEKTLEIAIEQLRKAMVDADSLSLSMVTSDKLSYGHSSGSVEDKAAFIGKIVSGRSDFETIQLSGTTMTFSGKTAIVRQHLDAVTKDNGKPGEVHLELLLVWQKEKGQWKLLARQAVKRPV